MSIEREFIQSFDERTWKSLINFGIGWNKSMEDLFYKYHKTSSFNLGTIADCSYDCTVYQNMSEDFLRYALSFFKNSTKNRSDEEYLCNLFKVVSFYCKVLSSNKDFSLGFLDFIVSFIRECINIGGTVKKYSSGLIVGLCDQKNLNREFFLENFDVFSKIDSSFWGLNNLEDFVKMVKNIGHDYFLFTQEELSENWVSFLIETTNCSYEFIEKYFDKISWHSLGVIMRFKNYRKITLDGHLLDKLTSSPWFWTTGEGSICGIITDRSLYKKYRNFVSSTYECWSVNSIIVEWIGWYVFNDDFISDYFDDPIFNFNDSGWINEHLEKSRSLNKNTKRFLSIIKKKASPELLQQLADSWYKNPTVRDFKGGTTIVI